MLPLLKTCEWRNKTKFFSSIRQFLANLFLFKSEKSKTTFRFHRLSFPFYLGVWSKCSNPKEFKSQSPKWWIYWPPFCATLFWKNAKMWISENSQSFIAPLHPVCFTTSNLKWPDIYRNQWGWYCKKINMMCWFVFNWPLVINKLSFCSVIYRIAQQFGHQGWVSEFSQCHSCVEFK